MTDRLVVKRSIVVAGHKTSVSMEDAFWDVVREAAALRSCTPGQLIEVIDRDRPEGSNLSSAIRLFALDEVLARRRKED